MRRRARRVDLPKVKLASVSSDPSGRSSQMARRVAGTGVLVSCRGTGRCGSDHAASQASARTRGRWPRLTPS